MKQRYYLFYFVTMATFIQCVQKNNDYISLTVSIAASGFNSLERAYKEVQAQIPLSLKEIPNVHYHMTLAGFNVYVPAGLNQMQKEHLKIELEHNLLQASKNAYVQMLRTKLIVPFAYIGVFAKKIVAIFEKTDLLQNLTDTIERSFRSNSRSLAQSGHIRNIVKHQVVLQPHVSLAKILDSAHGYFGAGLVPERIQVKDFLINKPLFILSAQWRS